MGELKGNHLYNEKMFVNMWTMQFQKLTYKRNDHMSDEPYLGPGMPVVINSGNERTTCIFHYMSFLHTVGGQQQT